MDWYYQFKIAAGEGALCELKLRLLAGKLPALQEMAVSERLEDIERAVADAFKDHVSVADVDLLRRCRQLRNKLLHCDFFELRKRLGAMGVAARSSVVRSVTMAPNEDADSMIRKIEGAAKGLLGTRVADTASTDEGTIYGWFAELANSGDLADAIGVFRKTCDLLDRLALAEPQDAVTD